MEKQTKGGEQEEGGRKQTPCGREEEGGACGQGEGSRRGGDWNSTKEDCQREELQCQ